MTMNRRDFMALGAVAALAPVGAFAKTIEYLPGLVGQRLAAGETVFLDFKASWCSTCKAQEKIMDRLKAANPAYEANVTFVAVDWDDYGSSDFTTGLNIPRRSTLVVLKGNDELGRLVADTREANIKLLMDTALKAATG